MLSLGMVYLQILHTASRIADGFIIVNIDLNLREMIPIQSQRWFVAREWVIIQNNLVLSD